MKKFLRDIRGVVEDRKKYLDNISQLLYNIRTGYKKKGYIMNVNKEAFSTNREQTALLDGKISSLYKIASEAADTVGARVVIAGGSVRDALLGLPVRDFDIFFLGIDAEEGDDTVVYLSELMKDRSPELGSHAATPIANYHTILLNSPTKRKFVGYEFTSRHLRRDVDFNQMQAFKPIQIIGRSEATPEELVDSFDYDLVRCWYDGSYNIDNRFELSLKSKRVPTEDNDTYDRVQRWKSRTGFKITVGRPPKKAPNPSSNFPNIEEITIKGIHFETMMAERIEVLNDPVWNANRVPDNF